MKRFLAVLGLFIVLTSGLLYADQKYNASPVAVILTSELNKASKVVTFAYTPREMYITNYDNNDGVWISFGWEDREPKGVNSKRYYIGPASSQDFYDYGVDTLTIILDNTHAGGNGIASPIVIMGLY